MHPFPRPDVEFTDPAPDLEPGTVIINGAAPAAPKSSKVWIWVVTSGLGVALLGGGWASSAIAGNIAQQKLNTATEQLKISQVNLDDANRRLSTTSSTIAGLKASLGEASSALSTASSGFEQAAKVQDASCKLIDSMFNLIPALRKGETVQLCESHADTLRSWGSDAATASGEASMAGQ